MAPARIRGALVMFWQLWVVAGKWNEFSLSMIANGHNRHFPWVLCQRDRQRCWSHRLAPAVWLRVHPVLYPHDWHLLLPGKPEMADEARETRQRVPIHEPLARAPYHRCTRLLLFVGHLRRGTSHGFWRRLLRSLERLLHRAQNQASELWRLDGHACPANVWH